MTEDDLLRAVLDLARILGLRTAHFRAAQLKDRDGEARWVTAVQGDGKGYPDLTIVGPGGVLFRELKSERGIVAPEQKAWLDDLAAGGADAGVWRPADLRSGRISTELRALRSSASRAQPARNLTAGRNRPAWMK